MEPVLQIEIIVLYLKINVLLKCFDLGGATTGDTVLPCPAGGAVSSAC
jgi:hypothetical protein